MSSTPSRPSTAPTRRRAAKPPTTIVLLAAALLAIAAVAGADADATAAAGQAKPTPTAAAAHPPPASLTEAERSLWQTEEAFAASFTARDPEKFASFLADEATFAGRNVLRGKAAVREAWTKMMMSGPVAPFSWRPSRSMVTGDLGTTAGPVYDPGGKWTGSFTSVWRRQPDGSWRIVLDSAPPCGEPKDEEP